MRPSGVAHYSETGNYLGAVALPRARRGIPFGLGLGEARRCPPRIGPTEDRRRFALDSAGGRELLLIPGSWRAYCLELLTRCWLTLGPYIEAGRGAGFAAAWATAVRLPMAATWADRAAAAGDLDGTNPLRAAERALASAAAAHQIGALNRRCRGHSLDRALVHASQGERGAAELRTVAAFDSFGALRYRDHAERGLRKLGFHIHRRTPEGKGSGMGIESLTERELRVARPVVDLKTNGEIGAELSSARRRSRLTCETSSTR